jgi:hypothetical protein
VNQRGSVSPVFITLFGVTILLMMVFLDREWLNYTLQLTEQTADFAAEAGGSTHEAWATVLVSRRQYWMEVVPVCDEYAADGTTCKVPMRDEQRLHTRERTISVGPFNEQELKENWTDQANCRRASPGELVMEPAWECRAVQIDPDLREVRFTEDTDPIAEQTFRRNWKDRGAAKLDDVWVYADASKRAVTVTAQIRVKSLFGVLPWERTVPVTGKAVTQLDDLVLK